MAKSIQNSRTITENNILSSKNDVSSNAKNLLNTYYYDGKYFHSLDILLWYSNYAYFLAQFDNNFMQKQCYGCL